MEASNISMNEEEKLNENTNKEENWRKIRHKYILQQIFAHSKKIGYNSKRFYKIL